MDMSSLKNKPLLLLLLLLIGCRRRYTCKEYVMSHNYTMLTIKNSNEKQIQNSSFIVKRNNKTINKGHLVAVEKLSNNRMLVKLKFVEKDTIHKTDTIYIKLGKVLHYITNTKEVCVESVGTPYIKIYKIDGTEFIEGEGFLQN